MSKSLKNSDVIYWKLYSRKLIPQTFQTAKFTKPQTNSTKRIHQKVSNCHSRFETSPKQILYVPNCRSRFETFRKQTPPWFEYRRNSKVSENQQNQDLKIFPDSVFQMLPQCINQKTHFSHEFFKWIHSRIALFKRMLSIHVNQTFGTSLPAKYSSYQPSINQQNIHTPFRCVKSSQQIPNKNLTATNIAVTARWNIVEKPQCQIAEDCNGIYTIQYIADDHNNTQLSTATS